MALQHRLDPDSALYWLGVGGPHHRSPDAGLEEGESPMAKAGLVRFTNLVGWENPAEVRTCEITRNKNKEKYSLVSSFLVCFFLTDEITKQYKFQALIITPQRLWHIVTRLWFMNSPETWNNDFMFPLSIEDVGLKEIQLCSSFMCLRAHILSHLSICHRKISSQLTSFHQEKSCQHSTFNLISCPLFGSFI